MGTFIKRRFLKKKLTIKHQLGTKSKFVVASLAFARSTDTQVFSLANFLIFIFSNFTNSRLKIYIKIFNTDSNLKYFSIMQ